MSKFKLDGKEWKAMNEDSIIITDMDQSEIVFKSAEANKVGGAKGIVLATQNVNFKKGDIIIYKIFAKRAIGKESGKSVYDVPVDAVVAKLCK